MTQVQSIETPDEPAGEIEQAVISSFAAAATDRSDTAMARDDAALARDEAADRRDVRAQAADDSVAASSASLTEKLKQSRASATAARARGASARKRSARDRVAAASERDHLEADLHNANLDDLTGAYRREMGDAALDNEIERARRADGRFIAAYVDVDDMKLINDRNGHPAGDELLRTLVATIRLNLRPFDPVVRYGGDEFVCGLGGLGLSVIKRRFAQINESVLTEVGTGISVGFAALEPGETLIELVARADACLLRAKKRKKAKARRLA